MKRTGTFSPYFRKLQREFYDQNCFQLCEALLGKVLVRKLPGGELVRGTIVETEAYPGGTDRASHAFGGRRTTGNESMYMDPGTCYVYFTYGMYHCWNISAQGEGAGTLIRAIEPSADCYDTLLRQRTAKKTKSAAASKNTKVLKPHEVANGPGKLCLAFDIRKDTCDKLDLVTSELMWIEENENTSFHWGNFTVETSKRVGIDSAPAEARDQLWRYFVADNFSVSTAKPSQIRQALPVFSDSRIFFRLQLLEQQQHEQGQVEESLKQQQEEQDQVEESLE